MARRTSSPAAADALPAPAAAAAEAGLLHVSDRDHGIRRLRCGRGFRYLDPDGKFERLPAFADALPRLGRHLRADLALPGFPREKVLALVVATLASTLVRVGNDAYARENRSYGLTTLRSRHARFPGGTLRLQFTGKGGKRHEVDVDDRRLARMLRAMHQLPGQRLFQYIGDDGAPHPVDSSMVKDYLRERMGGDFTAKDFRTWGGTLAAFRLLAASPPPAAAGTRTLAAIQNEVLAEVSCLLGNTVAVCRTSYVDPCMFEGWQDGSLARTAGQARGRRQWEQAARRFLARAHARRGTAAVTPGKRPRR